MSELSEFSIKQLIYIDWLAISKYERRPATEQLLAKELKVTDRTLRRWKHLPGFKQAIIKRAREFLGNDLPEVYGALRREAIKGSFYHIKLVLEMTGEYTQKTEQTLEIKVENPLDKLRSRLDSITTAERERGNHIGTNGNGSGGASL